MKILDILRGIPVENPPCTQFQWRKFQDGMGEPPYEYDFLYNLPESEYPKYLAKIFNCKTGEKLPLHFDFCKKSWIIDKNKCKTFNQKIQWIKLYGVTDLMRDCTDKVKVRDYVKEKIGEEYLKPVLQIIPNDTSVIANHNSILGGEAIQEEVEQMTMGKNKETKSINFLDCHGTEKAVVPRNDRKSDDVSTYFDQIDFDKLPDSFVLKCNHGCKWQYIIKDKNLFLQNKRLFELVKKNITGWLEQEYWVWEGFELQYKGIEPKILIEPLMRENINISCWQIHVYCFNGKAEYIIQLQNDYKMIAFDRNINIADCFISHNEKVNNIKYKNLINQSIDLSEKLAKNFNFVRVDWMIADSGYIKQKSNLPQVKTIYFGETTFTPYSGLILANKKLNLKLGNLM